MHYIALYCTQLHYITLYYTILHYIALYCTQLHYIALYCTIMIDKIILTNFIFIYVVECTLWDTAELTIEVTDYNDNPPVLQKSKYSSRKLPAHYIHILKSLL